MMDVGPDPKRARLAAPPPPASSWQSQPERQLPPPPPQASTSYPPPHLPPFSRPEPQHPSDRRPSEHPQYDQHSYGHHPQPPYPRPTEPMVKRDPSDEPQPPQYRPTSTGNGSDHNVNVNLPHHEGAGRTYLPPFDPARQQYPSSYPPAPTPMSATDSYNNPYGGLPQPREGNPYPSVSYPATRQPDVRKKAQRAAQACDSCRNLKAKCDEGRPSCSTCKEKGFDCRYRDPPPKQQDKVSADIMEFLLRLERKVDQMDGSLTDVKRILNYRPISSTVMKEEEPDENYQMPTGAYVQASVASEPQTLPPNDSPYSSTPGMQKAPDMLEAAQPQEEVSEEEEEEEEEESGDPGPPKAPSIPVNHTTGAARLLLVGPIKEMCKGAIKSARIKSPYPEKYPIVQEERRGLLRLFGRGEGYDAPPGYDKDPLTDHGDSTPGDTPSNVSSPAAGEEWGQLGGLTPPGNPPPEITRGGISPEGMPDFSRDTVCELVRSYKTNINNMHPILVPSQLDALVEQFLKSIPEGQAKPRQVSTVMAGQTSHAGHSPAGFVGSYRNPESPGNKRKRSPVSGEYPEAPAPTVIEYKPGHPFRSISSALVLLVMALGKICLHKGRIPNIASDKENDASFGNSPTIRNGHPPSPLQSSPSLSAAMGMASPQDIDKVHPRSRRTSLEGGYGIKGSWSRPRNLDTIPGLAYFALATDVLGNQLAGNSLQHVHANILAGLYHGQLGRVMESHGYIAAACRSLQIILRPKLDRFKRLRADMKPVPQKDNALLFAFWTCLQLESDIVAELPCPHSGILTYEEDIPGINITEAIQTDKFDHRIIESYTAQLFLRKHLNQLHNMFYKPEADNQFPQVVIKEPSGSFRTIEACEENLNMIKVAAPNMLWDVDKGEPADDILGARLRAKYYGAQVITYRLFVLKILESSSNDGEQISSEFKPNIDAPVVGKDIKRIEDFQPDVREYARNGIKALIYSTKAFHGLGDPGRDRLIVTNVWGTAHAQFGNMLVLSAAYVNPILSNLVLEFLTKEELRDLFSKTMSFIQLNSTPTSALAIDYKILDHVGRIIGLFGPEGPLTSSSFSSSNTDVLMSGQYPQ